MHAQIIDENTRISEGKGKNWKTKKIDQLNLSFKDK